MHEINVSGSVFDLRASMITRGEIPERALFEQAGINTDTVHLHRIYTDHDCATHSLTYICFPLKINL